MPPNDGPEKSMGSDTKKYLASFIKDLRVKADKPHPLQEAKTPPTAKTAPILFSGSLSQEPKPLGADGESPSIKATPNHTRIVLTEKEREMLKTFSKLK
mgnify:CR=1 FL=1